MARSLVTALTALAVASTASAETMKPQLVVMDLRLEHGLKPGISRLLNELLLTEIQASNRFNVMGSSDVAALVSSERQKDLMGCDDVSCLIELAGALDADYLFAANLGAIGKQFLVNSKLLDVRRAKVMARASHQVRSEEQLTIAVRAVVKDTLEQYAAATGGKAEAAALHPAAESASTASVTEEATPTPKTKYVGFALIGLGGVAAGVGVALGISAKNENDKLEHYPATEVEARKPIEDAANSRALGADLAFAGAMIAAGAGVLLVLRSGGEEPAGDVAIAPLVSDRVVGATARVEL